ncbi:MAG: mechanosensitive ion channel [Acidimicrobiia bacterium]|nr:mechanosensitive ion channel [Acidimicrobiia bacterium]
MESRNHRLISELRGAAEDLQAILDEQREKLRAKTGKSSSRLYHASLRKVGLEAPPVAGQTSVETRDYLSLVLNLQTRVRFFIKWFQPVLRISMWFVAAFFVFDLLAPSRDAFLATVASVGIALGLGAQDLVKNIIGGLVVLTDRPFQLGDRVKMGEAYGEIDHIGLRSTKLTTPDDTRVTIPNSDILSNQVYNANSGVPDCQVVTDLFLPPDTDPEMARRVGWEAALCCPYLLSRKPIVTLVGHGFDRRPYLRLRIKCYVHDHRFEPPMISDITARAAGELNRLGVLVRWTEFAET